MNYLQANQQQIIVARQAMYAGKAPLVALEASHRNALRVNTIEEMSSP